MGSCQSKATFIYDGCSFDFIGSYYASLAKKRGHSAAIDHHAIGLDIRSVTINYK
ncbi:MAG: hypothetical protein RL035_415, partial [Pseudomonadota bacterium]